MKVKLLRALLFAASLAACCLAQGAAQASSKIAIVGDGTLSTIVLDQSAVPCGPPPYPVPCAYEDDSASAFPHALATANTIEDLSAIGSAADAAPNMHSISVVIAAQVPQIARDTDAVIVNVGASETSSEEVDADVHQLDRLVLAIRKRAPRTRIIFLSLRDANATSNQRINTWNLHERRVATLIGATLIDMNALFPATDFPDFPDSTHPSRVGSARLADALAHALGQTRVAGAPTAPPVASSAVAVANASALPSRETRLNIAVLGSSMERTVVLDGSPMPCGDIMRATPCKYQYPSPIAYPNVLGELANANIYNLATPGSQAADVVTSGKIPSALDAQVPQIPSSADVVILEIGLNDTSINGIGEIIEKRINEVAEGVRRRVPHARIVFVSLRDYGASVRARIDAWNAREQQVAMAIGATFVDIRTPFPATDFVDFPDGTHASKTGSLHLAQLISDVIDKMREPAPQKNR